MLRPIVDPELSASVLTVRITSNDGPIFVKDLIDLIAKSVPQDSDISAFVVAWPSTKGESQ